MAREDAIKPAAKERQKLSKGRGKKGPDTCPDLKSDSRDIAGKEFGISGRTVSWNFFQLNWLSRIDKDSKEARDRRMFDLWLACWTDTEIGYEVGLTSQAAGQVIKELADLPKLSKVQLAAAEHRHKLRIVILTHRCGGRVKYRPDLRSRFLAERRGPIPANRL